MVIPTEIEAKAHMLVDPDQFVYSYICALRAIEELEFRLVSSNPNKVSYKENKNV